MIYSVRTILVNLTIFLSKLNLIFDILLGPYPEGFSYCAARGT